MNDAHVVQELGNAQSNGLGTLTLMIGKRRVASRGQVRYQGTWHGQPKQLIHRASHSASSHFIGTQDLVVYCLGILRETLGSAWVPEWALPPPVAWTFWVSGVFNCRESAI